MPVTPDLSRRLSEISKRAWQDPAYREPQLRRLQALHEDHEIKVRMISGILKYNTTPARRAQSAAAMTRRWADPVERAKLLAPRKTERARRTRLARERRRRDIAWAGEPDATLRWMVKAEYSFARMEKKLNWSRSAIIRRRKDLGI